MSPILFDKLDQASPESSKEMLLVRQFLTEAVEKIRIDMGPNSNVFSPVNLCPLAEEKAGIFSNINVTSGQSLYSLKTIGYINAHNKSQVCEKHAKSNENWLSIPVLGLDKEEDQQLISEIKKQTDEANTYIPFVIEQKTKISEANGDVAMQDKIR